MVEGKIKDGYKKTEVGVIPIEWHIKRLCDLTSQIGDGIHTTPEYINISDFYFINGNNLADGIVIINQETKCISYEEYNKHRLNLSDRTILMSINGTIGNIAYFKNENVILGKSACYIDIKSSVNKEFIFYQLQSKYIINYYNNELTGSTIKNLSLRSIRNTPIVTPGSDEEQKAISEALINTDKLLQSLEKQIDKMKKIKQGTMQQLLTGKKRLDGFSGQINFVSLKSLCSFFSDGDWIESKDQSESGYRLIQTGNVGIGVYLDKSGKKRYISKETFVRLNCTEIYKNDVLVSRLPEPAGRACLIPETKELMITAVDCTIIRFHDYNAVLFVNYTQIYDYQKQIDMMISGSTRKRISKKELGDVIIPVFPSEKEQAAISNILTDMDLEIKELEQKLEKYKKIKQGMMQELLTGRIRLA